MSVDGSVSMKGVVLAGGLGTRLRPMTLVTNKHLLPVYDRPMVYYPIEALTNIGIDEVLVVTGGEHAGDFLKLLKNGKDLGVRHLEYAYQEGEGGIAEALLLAEDFADGERVCVILGDNLIQGNLRRSAQAYLDQERGARLVLKATDEAGRFGVAAFEGDPGTSRIRRIVEKPAEPPSRFAVTGVYFYDQTAFDVAKTLEPSGRGELEITDVNNAYLERGALEYDVLKGWWADAGTVASLHQASLLVADGGANRLDLDVAELF